jgi:cytochrome P450
MADDATAAPALSPAAPKPAHVPDALVYDFDLFADPGLLADSHARILEIATTAPPIFWTPRQGGHWVFAGHEAAFEGSRDWETFTSEFVPQAQIQAMLAQMPPGAPNIPQPLPINVDPPLHGKYRLPLNGVFSPKSVNKLKDSIRALAHELIAKIAPQGRCEFMSAVAEIMPVQVFLKMLGLPLERQAEYRELVKEHLSSLDSNPQESMRKLQRIAAIMRPTFEERRETPQDDIISLLWRTELDGVPTTMNDMENYGVVLFIAGLDTVMNGIGLGVRRLATDLELQDRLRAEPALVADATEEMLRRYTFTVPVRKVTKDVVFQGVELKAGERIDLFLPAADLDPTTFNQPERYELQREDKVHIAFGAGPHRCLGSHLARVELQILYEELLAGLPRFRLDPQKPPRFHGGHVIGPETLHLVWDA